MFDKWAKRHHLSLADAAEVVLNRRVRVHRKTYRRAVDAVMDGGVEVSLSTKISALLTRQIDDFKQYIADNILSDPPLYEQLKGQLDNCPVMPEGLHQMILQTGNGRR